MGIIDGAVIATKMGRVMRRSKQQIMHRFLPGRTFDFERSATIARVQNIRGNSRTDLNLSIVLRKIRAQAVAWDAEFRPSLRDEILTDASNFVLLDPIEVRADLFPKVFWCQTRTCGRITSLDSQSSLTRRCQRCRLDSLVQLRFVRIHRCGELQPLLPPQCARCNNSRNMALDMRGSERIANFRWICRNRGCTTQLTIFPGFCPACQWPGSDNKIREMSIEVHRAGRTYYPHTSVLLNIPNRDLDAFLAIPGWEFIAAGKFLQLPDVGDRPLSDFRSTAATDEPGSTGGLTGNEVDALTNLLAQGEISPEKVVEQIQALHEKRRGLQRSTSAAGIAQAVIERSGVERAVWERAGQELLEAVMPFETNMSTDLYEKQDDPLFTSAILTGRSLGLPKITLITDFPIPTATFGYSRVEYRPNQCRLNPFSPQPEHQGKYPIFVDQVQADALSLALNPIRLSAWLERNGYPPSLPRGTDDETARRAFFVQLLNDAPLFQTLGSDRPQARMVFGLLHTLSHLCLRQAGFLCGLDSTSLSEYILPRALTLAIYSNHRSGATIGALTALFEQTLVEWLRSVRDKSRCVYDPVCYEREGNCHACTHLAETSCRFFNLNLSRAFLFGGFDQQLGRIEVGYFDPSLT